MTIIVGYSSREGTYLGSDSRITADGVIAGSTKKLFQLHDNLSIGVCGSLRDLNIIKHVFRPYAPSNPTAKCKELCEEYLVSKFIPDLVETLSSQHRLSAMDEEGNESIKWQGNLMIAIGKHLFGLYNDFAVIDLGRFGAIGSGEAYAMGFLSDMEKAGLTGEEIVRRAIISSGKFDTGCDNKVDILKVR